MWPENVPGSDVVHYSTRDKVAKRSSNEAFVRRAQSLHGQRYDYSRSAYRNTYTPVVIVCSQHGPFKQQPAVHLRGSGCPHCAVRQNTMSQKDFLMKAHEVHGDEYDYSQVEYRNAKTPVSIICKTHGVFAQLADNHLCGMGCLDCGRKRAAGKRTLTMERFLKQAAGMHGNRYDYSRVRYVTGLSRVTIVCPEHGAFEQTGTSHLAGKGCPECAKATRGAARRSSRADFIRKARETHGDTYDYSRVAYQLSRRTVMIICRTHGAFEQMPSSHLRGSGCPQCAQEAMKESRRWTDAKFINEAIRVHGDRYDYSRVRYESARTSVTIVCKEHGPFGQSPYSHLRGSGCPRCALVRQARTQSTSFATFVARANEVHKGRYSYDKTQHAYINLSTKVTITCPYHGDFEQLADGHIRGRGCPECSESLGEKRIVDWLESNGVVFERQKTFAGLLGRNRRPLSFDFYVPELRVLIEFDGIQHFEPVGRWGGKAKLESIQDYDHLKSVWAGMEGYSLRRIRHDQIEGIEGMLESMFNADWLKQRRLPGAGGARSDRKRVHVDDRMAPVLEAVMSRGGAIIAGGYAGAKAKITIRCRNGHTWDARPDHLKRGVWCPLCAGNVKLDLGEMRRIAGERGGRCLSREYVNYHRKLRWQCAQGHEWEAAPEKVRRGTWCPVCALGRGHRHQKGATFNIH